MTLDYRIVVPSRKRAANMPVLRSLLPTATICVDEREHAEYAQFVPESKLLLHPPLEGLPAVFNWMQTAVKEQILIEIDDDFVGVITTTGKARRITDPTSILSILENAAQNTQDLGLSAFCFSRNPNPAMLKSDQHPIRPVHPYCAAVGMMGPARHRRYDETLLGREDIDWCLRTLLAERILYCDVRFYFDFGRAGAGRGGNVDIVTAQHFKHATRELTKRYGCHIGFGKNNFSKARTVSPMSIRVKRTNPMAHR